MGQPTTACFCNGAVTSWFKVLSSFNVFVSWDRTRLRKGTTAETQTLAAIQPIPETRLISEANVRHPDDIPIRSRFSKLMLSFARPMKQLAHHSP
ncbi:MAG: hypothetical protein O9294_18675, partial [Cytophagales bacterium]|nr:hypothetical protein [Cytophagales bacterium]